MLMVFLLPLVSCVISFLLTDRYAWVITLTAPLLQLISMIGALIVFFSLSAEPYTLALPWFHIGEFIFSANLQINAVSAIMLVVVTVVSFLVHVYSTGYMAGDENNRRYFAMLGFFTFSMLGIVLADNLLLIFVFWELVGFSSYMLIGHWNQKPAAVNAARKAFIFNRIGDAGFLIGLMIIWANAGTFELRNLLLQTEVFSWQTSATLCIFCGVIGKSAQFPLFTWLPDAMEGPTPVSALIHAATMVAAGVFLLSRIFALYTPEALDVVALIGIITAVLSALSALVQTDIKKILAYSTISQLGLMVTAIGAGAADAAMLHLFTHAFFKACLFLSAGAVIHVLHQAQQQTHTHFDVQDIRNLGGLRKKLPATFFAFALSGSALAGIPFFSGFVSKDAIFTGLWNWATMGTSWRWIVVVSAFLVSFITVLYTFRLVWFMFMGEEKSTQALDVTEAPLVMRLPIIILAVASLWFIITINPVDFNGWLFQILHPGKYFHFNLMAAVSASWVLLALGTAHRMYRTGKNFNVKIFQRAFYLDFIYQLLFEKPVLALASFTDRIDRHWIDGVLHSGVYAQVTLAHIIGWFDKWIIDGSVNAVAATSNGLGSFTRSFQGGKIQLYIFWSIFGLIIFLIWMLL
ncbi:MAG: NADH-quinone oxidoreductase subunit L [Cyclobacteriaceae bacterium]|nr:NADH-quinone oxidoreductase subunit L [Cyclobacteriaceae bacterium]